MIGDSGANSGGPQRCAAAPFSAQLGSAALGGAGLAVRLAVLVALVAGLLALAAHSGGQR